MWLGVWPLSGLCAPIFNTQTLLAMNNRQIRFRVVDKNLGEVFGYERFSPTNGWTHCLTWETQDSQTWRPGIISEKMDSQFKRLQFTGLKDKEGQGVYEWDILKTFHFEDNEGEANYLYHLVEWSREYASWFAVNARDKSFEEPKRGNGTIQLWIYMKNSEPIIAGNKHANPELLEA